MNRISPKDAKKEEERVGGIEKLIMDTALYQAAENGYTSTVQALIESGARVNTLGEKVFSPPASRRIAVAGCCCGIASR